MKTKDLVLALRSALDRDNLINRWASEDRPFYKDSAYSVERILEEVLSTCPSHTFPLGTRVTKLRGSSWTGRVVGHYQTEHTPDGSCVESENEPGNVQIYNSTWLRAMGDDE